MQIKKGCGEYGDSCFDCSVGALRMALTAGFGPRIIHFSFGNGPNILFVDRKKEIHLNDWFIYGGHRLWTSPEEYDSYSPDNSACEVIEKSDSLTLINHDRKLHLDKALTVSEKNGRFQVTHSITNKGDFLYTGALWALTCVIPAGTVFLPWGSPCREWETKKIQYWKKWGATHASTIGSRQYVETPDLFLIRPSGEEGKVGTAGYEGFIGITSDGYTFIKKFNRNPSAVYPDDNCAIESYTCRYFIELETLSPLYTMGPGETYSHTEEWILVDKKINPENGAEARALL